MAEGSKQSSRSNTNWALIVIIIILALIIMGGVGACGGYLIYKGMKASTTPTPNSNTSTALPGADFRTYTNENYGYSLSVPTSWSYSADTSATSETALFADYANPTVGDQNKTGVSVYIATAPNPSALSVSDWVNQSNKDYGGPIASSTEEKISGEDAVVQSGEGEFGSYTVVYFGRGTNIYRLNYVGPSQQYQANLTKFEKMYRSFGFR